MKLRTPSGNLPFRLMTFPDGQRHFELLGRDNGGWSEVTIETALRCADDVFDVLLAKDVLSVNGYITNLNIRYLLGARMDRRINSRTPFTLGVVGRMLAAAGFRRIAVLDPHSSIACEFLNASAVYPTSIAERILSMYLPSRTAIIVPDKGATARVDTLLRPLTGDTLFRRVQCVKQRDSATGRLSGFVVEDATFVDGKECLILDDICDGGGTFSGIADKLHAAGALSVDLFVTHGLFTKRLPLDGIRRIYTTNSCMSESSLEVTVFPFEMLCP